MADEASLSVTAMPCVGWGRGRRGGGGGLPVPLTRPDYVGDAGSDPGVGERAWEVLPLPSPGRFCCTGPRFVLSAVWVPSVCAVSLC